MDRNILEEYQSRIQEILKILEENPEFAQDGVEKSENKIENRLAELQLELEEVQAPVDMSDVSVTLIDRISPMKEEYSNDREGYLLREYDTRRLNGYAGPEFAEIVEELQAVRTETKAARRIAIQNEIDSLTGKRGAIETVSEFQTAKTQMTTEMRDATESIKAKIAAKMAKVNADQEKVKSADEEALVHAEALALYKGHSMNYTAPKKLLEECQARKEKANIRIARENRKIANLQKDLGTIEELLSKIQTIDETMPSLDNQKQEQEEQAWGEYEAEQTRKEKEEIDAAYTEKEIADQKEEERVAQETQKEVEEYYKGQAEGEEQGQKPPKSEKPQKTVPPKPVPPKSEKSQKTVPPKSEKSQKTVPPKSGKWQVESVSFTTEGGPVYKVIVTNGQETQEVTSTVVAALDQDFDREEIDKLHRQLLPEAEKYYDKGLAIALKKADEMYQTDGLRKYIKTLQDKEIIFKTPNIHKPSLKIDYDFSGLTGKMSSEMRKVQKIAKANNKKGVLAGFKGRPNFLVRLIQKLLTKSLPEPAKEEIATATEKPEKMTAQEEMMQRMEEELENQNEKTTMRNWAMMRGEEGFDIEEFVKDMPIEEANKYRVLQDEYEEDLAKQNPYKGFREKMKESIVKGPIKTEAQQSSAKETPTIIFEEEKETSDNDEHEM